MAACIRIAEFHDANALLHRILASLECQPLDNLFRAPDFLDIDEVLERDLEIFQWSGQQPIFTKHRGILWNVHSQRIADLHDGLRAKAAFQVAMQLCLRYFLIIHTVIFSRV
jgi:hypothetical protein